MKLQTLAAATLLCPAAGITVLAGSARLYDMSTGTVIEAKFSSWKAAVGHGKLRLMLPSGEKLEGEFNATHAGATAWGSIYNTVYGTGGYASGYSPSEVSVVSNLAEGTAVLVGPQTTIDCEFIASGLHGRGACRDNTGKMYRMMF